ncbi:hypothetical protein KJ682_03025 [bacterium]|nr:hypothetical protein [bacterium]
MKTLLWAMALVLLVPALSLGDGPGWHDPLVDKLAGTWVMTGTIAGGPVVHDIEAEWVLNHYYLRLTETSRETDAEGKPVYEAIVMIGWNDQTSRYVCQWLDSTGGGGLVDGAFGHAVREGDSLPFVFNTGPDTAILNTFSYHKDRNVWTMAIDNQRGDVKREFARVTLTRAPERRLEGFGGEPSSNETDSSPRRRWSRYDTGPVKLIPFIDRTPAEIEMAAREYFTESTDGNFRSGPNRPNPHSWLTPMALCDEICDFEVIRYSEDEGVIATYPFTGVDPGAYRVEVEGAGAAESDTGVWKIRYRGEIMLEFRIVQPSGD